MDVDGIDPGQDFRKAIDAILTECDLLLAVIAKNWLDCNDETGKRRLDDPRDFCAPQDRQHRERTFPKADQLPDELRDFALRNAFELISSC
jgi:hypothetical protein